MALNHQYRGRGAYVPIAQNLPYATQEGSAPAGHVVDQASSNHSAATNALKALFGQDISISNNRTLAGNNGRMGLPNATHSYQYIVSGRAKVIECTLGTVITSTYDPIRLILPVELAEAGVMVYIIREEEVVGSSANFLSDRVQGRANTIKPNEHSFNLTVIGNNVSMNSFEFSELESAIKNYNLKLNGQIEAIQQMVNAEAWKVLMANSTSFEEAVMLSSQSAHHLDARDREKFKERVSVQLFNAYIKPNGFRALMSMVPDTGVAMIGSAPNDFNICIIPDRAPATMQYTLAENVVYAIKGVPQQDASGRMFAENVMLPAKDVLKETSSGITLARYRPASNTSAHGTAHPVAGRSAIAREIKFGAYYPVDTSSPRCRVFNFKENSWQEFNVSALIAKALALLPSGTALCDARTGTAAERNPPTTTTKYSDLKKYCVANKCIGIWTSDTDYGVADLVLVRPCHRVLASATIFAKAGEETGKIVIARPIVNVGLDPMTAEQTTRLSLYQGAYIAKRQNIITMHGTFIDCHLGGHGCKLMSTKDDNVNNYDLIPTFLVRPPEGTEFAPAVSGTLYVTDTEDEIAKRMKVMKDNFYDRVNTAAKNATIRNPATKLNPATVGVGPASNGQTPVSLWPGRIDAHTPSGWQVTQENTGHMMGVDGNFIANGNTQGLRTFDPASNYLKLGTV